MKVVTALQVKLTAGEGARLLAKGTKNLEAYLKFLQAREVFNTQTREAAEILRMNPRFSVEERAKFIPLKNRADLDRYLDGLRKAGLN